MRGRVGIQLAILLALASASAAEPRGVLQEEVAPGIYRSAQPDAAALRAARARGVRTVVVLRSAVPEPERGVAAELGLDLVHVPMDGARMPSIDEVDQALAVVLDPSKRPVLVHCAHGEERTGAVIAAYRVVADGWDPAAAEKEAIEHGFGFDDLEGFLLRYRDHWLQR